MSFKVTAVTRHHHYSLLHFSEKSDLEGFLTSQENGQQDNKPSLIKLNALKNIMEGEKIDSAADRLKISDNSLTMLLASFIKGLLSCWSFSCEVRKLSNSLFSL